MQKLSSEMTLKILQLEALDLDGDNACCTGPQVALVLRMLLTVAELHGCRWYASSIETYPAFGEFEDGQFEAVEDVVRLLEKIDKTQQLFDGIIAAIPSAEAPNVRSHIVTADGPMESLVSNSLVEVHAFDTSWVEIYSEIPEVIDALQGRFGGKLANTPS